MGLLTKDKIKKAQDFKVEKVAVPEWDKDGFLFVKTLSAHERDALDNMLFTMNPETGAVTQNAVDFRTKWVVACACDAKANLLFAEEDVEWLSKKSSKAVQRVFQKAQDLNGVSKAEREAMEKNLGSDQDTD